MADFNELMEYVAESTFDDAEAYLEGTNREISKIGKTTLKDCKKLMKEAKNSYKKGDASATNKKLDEITKKLDEALSDIDDIDDTVGSVIIGYYYQGFCSALKGLLLGLCTFGIGTAISSIKDTIDIISGGLEQWDKENKNFTPKLLNMRRQKVRALLNSYKKVVSNFKKEVVKSIKETEKAEDTATEESADMSDEIKLEIYESCYYGEISEDERDILLDLMD